MTPHHGGGGNSAERCASVDGASFAVMPGTEDRGAQSIYMRVEFISEVIKPVARAVEVSARGGEGWECI